MKYDKWLKNTEKIKEWSSKGLTDRELSQKMGIAYSTLRVWRDKYPEIEEALAEGKAVADGNVERSLYARAIGYSYKEIRTTKQGGKTKTETWERHSPPDVTAMIYWLKNRKPYEWRDRREHDVTENELKKVDELISGINKMAEAKNSDE